MKHKFKVGDKVKVTNPSDEAYYGLSEIKKYLNQTGTVSRVNEGSTYPYDVVFDDKKLVNYDLCEEELSKCRFTQTRIE